MYRLFMLIVFWSMQVLYVSAQNEEDILRYSVYQIGGNARAVALGGATGAMGADISSLSNNPAGLGLFRKSEFTLSASVFNASNSSDYFSQTTKTGNTSFHFPNLGVVKANTHQRKGKPVDKGWMNYNFGFSLNRAASYNSTTDFAGMNNSSSYLQSLAQQANGTDYNQLSNFTDYGLAWKVYLIDTVGNNSAEYKSSIPQGTGLLLQQLYRAEREGRINDYNFSYGTSYNDVLYLGATLTLSSVRFRVSSSFYEGDVYDTINSGTVPFDAELTPYSSMRISDELNTSGFGINGKLGLIYSPFEFIRIGAAYHTPRYLSMNDYFSKSITVGFDDGSFASLSSGEGYYEYTIQTPGKSMFSVTGILAKKGLINVDVEQVDYRNGKLKSSDYSFSEANQMANQFYRKAMNIKAGAEYRYGYWYFRGGYAMMGNPYKSSIITNKEGRTRTVTGGVGYRKGDYYLDCAFATAKSTSFYTPYVMVSGAETPTAVNSIIRNSFIVTGGFKF
jgi:hypothetical protein